MYKTAAVIQNQYSNRLIPIPVELLGHDVRVKPSGVVVR
jgi:hypothetical protein